MAKYILIVGAVIIVILFLAVENGIYNIVFRCLPPDQREDRTFDFPKAAQYEGLISRIRDLVENMAGIPFEWVQTKSRDGLTLYARHYYQETERQDAAGPRVALLFHGYKSSAVRDFAGGAYELRKLGYHVILVDQRGQGRSQGRCICFGAKEKFDVIDWIRWTQKEFGQDVPIDLYGISMGAATVLMTAGMDYGANVHAIVADCPYSSAKSIIRTVMRDHYHLSPGAFYPLVSGAAKLLGHFSLAQADVMPAVRKAKVPILIIHGTSDEYVPSEESLRIAKASPAMIKRVTFEGAGHGLSYMRDHDRYLRCLKDFLQDPEGFAGE